MMAHVMRLIERKEAETGEPHVPSSCNFAVTDGIIVIATRFRDVRYDRIHIFGIYSSFRPGDASEPPSLYYSECIKVESASHEMVYKYKKRCVQNQSGLLAKHNSEELSRETDTEKEEVDSIIISSEPIYKSEEAWNLVPDNSLIVVTPRHNVIIEKIELDEVPAEELNMLYAPTPAEHREKEPLVMDLCEEKREFERSRTRTRKKEHSSLERVIRNCMSSKSGPANTIPTIKTTLAPPVILEEDSSMTEADRKGREEKKPRDRDPVLPEDEEDKIPRKKDKKDVRGKAERQSEKGHSGRLELSLSRGFLLSVLINVMLMILLHFAFRGALSTV